MASGSELFYICGVCHGTVGQREASIACRTCRNWIHLKRCAKLSFKEAKKLKDSYSCPTCVNVVIPGNRVSNADLLITSWGLRIYIEMIRCK